MPVLLIVAIVFIIIEAIIEIKKGTNISTYIISCVIGLVIALIFDLSLLGTVAVALCYEGLVVSLFSVVYMIVMTERFRKRK